jgi:hypothetical protein
MLTLSFTAFDPKPTSAMAGVQIAESLPNLGKAGDIVAKFPYLSALRAGMAQHRTMLS